MANDNKGLKAANRAKAEQQTLVTAKCYVRHIIELKEIDRK